MQGESMKSSDAEPEIFLFANNEKRHYVAVIRKVLEGQSELSWVMFNDEKVVKFEEADGMKESAYMYFFTRL